MSGAWDRLTPAARQVMGLAAEESEQLGHGYLGDEHVILGLLRGRRAARRRCCWRTASILVVAAPSYSALPQMG